MNLTPDNPPDDPLSWFGARMNGRERPPLIAPPEPATVKAAAAVPRPPTPPRTLRAPPPSKVVARRASDLPPALPPKWLAVGWLPRWAVTVLCGDEGIGKSLLWVLIVAYVTTGRALAAIGLPARKPQDCIVVITEDSWAEVAARLTLAGADMNRIHLISEDSDGTGSPVFPPDMDVVTELAARIKPALIVLDAWLDTIDSGITVKDAQQARTALHPWRETATKFGCSVLLLVNTNRMSEASTRDRVGATGELRKKARMMLFAAAEAEGEGAQLFVGPDKANGVARGNAVRFDIGIEQVRPRTVDDPGTVAMLRRPVEQDKRISALIEQWRADDKEAKKPPTADQKAESWLLTYMAANRGRVPTTTVQAAALEAGHSAKRIAAVLKTLGGVSKPLGEAGRWYFLLNPVSALSAVSPVGSDTADPAETGLFPAESAQKPVSAPSPVSLPSVETAKTAETDDTRKPS